MFEHLPNEIVYNHVLAELDNADLWSMMNVNNKYKDITKKFVDTKAIERINYVFDNIFAENHFIKKNGDEVYEYKLSNEEFILGIGLNLINIIDNSEGIKIDPKKQLSTHITSSQQFKEYLQQNNATISGGFVLRSILNKNWKTDIDIYLPNTTKDKNLLNIQSKIYHENDFKVNCEYVQADNDDINIKYVMEDFYEFSTTNSALMKNQNISCLQRICQKSDDTRECDKDFDFRICKNTYWYDGKDNIKITNYCDVLTSNCKIFDNKQRKYNTRLTKYIDRGFTFAKSKLFSCFIDFLQEYTKDELKYNKWSSAYKDHMVRYEIIHNKIKTKSHYTRKIVKNICKSKCEVFCKTCHNRTQCYYRDTYSETRELDGQISIVDNIKCFHYDKWQKDKTICNDCYTDNYIHKYEIGDYLTIKGLRINEKSNQILHFGFLEADNISEIIKTQYNLQ